MSEEWPQSFLGKILLFVTEWAGLFLFVAALSWLLCQVVLHILRPGMIQ